MWIVVALADDPQRFDGPETVRTVDAFDASGNKVFSQRVPDYDIAQPLLNVRRVEA